MRGVQTNGTVEEDEIDDAVSLHCYHTLPRARLTQVQLQKAREEHEEQYRERRKDANQERNVRMHMRTCTYE